MSLYQYKLSLPETIEEGTAYLISQLYDQQALSVSIMRESGSWNIIWLFQDKGDYSRFEQTIVNLEDTLGVPLENNYELKTFSDINWLEETYKQFPPFTVGPFYIYGSHSKEPQPEHKVSLNIDAATAFGSGEHATTKGCLLFLDKLHKMNVRPKNIIDIGTGSGILAIAAYKLFNSYTVATDIDPESIKLARTHINKNKIEQENINLLCSNGLEDKRIKNHAPYNLLLANILAEPLVNFSNSFIEVLDNDSYLILSGILDEQREKVLNAYTENKPLSLIDVISSNDWSTLLLKKQ
jgi:ribosomal protein L11 methyltransferase